MTVQRISDREEIGLAAFIEERVDRSRKPGRKRAPRGECVLPRTAEHLIRRIVKATAGGSETWAEANDEVARALHVDRSTVVRMVRRLCEVGILDPVATKGGRGRVSVYSVDRSRAEEALRSRRWPLEAQNRLTQEMQKRAHEAAHLEEPDPRTPPFPVGEVPGETAPIGGPQRSGPNTDRPSGAPPLFGDLDSAVLEVLFSKSGSAGAFSLGSGLRRWWEAQPEGVRRAFRAGGVEAGVVAVAGLLGGWRTAAVAALLGAPIAIVYALSPDKEKPATDVAEPIIPAPVHEPAVEVSTDPLFRALANTGSRPLL